MNGVNQWIKNNKGIILKVLIILGIIFCIFGVMNVIFENTIFNLLKLYFIYISSNYILYHRKNKNLSTFILTDFC